MGEGRKIKNKGGRPKKEIDYNLVENLCKLQCTGEEIASALNIDYKTLNLRINDKYKMGFSQYYKKASAGGKMSLRRKQMEVAMSGNVSMLIWLGKQYLGQSDHQEINVADLPEIKINVIGN